MTAVPSSQVRSDAREIQVRFSAGGREPLMSLIIDGVQHRVKDLTPVYSFFEPPPGPLRRSDPAL